MQRGPSDELAKRSEGFHDGTGRLFDSFAILHKSDLAGAGTVPRVKRLAGRGEPNAAGPRQSQHRYCHGHPGGPGGAEHQERTESQRSRDRAGA